MATHPKLYVYSLLILAKLALGAVVKRQLSSECLYQFVTQPWPPADLWNSSTVCNPFEEGFTLECSVLVQDSTPGNLTIEWIYNGVAGETVLDTFVTETSPGANVTSEITINEVRPGPYFCRPTSSQVGPLRASTALTVFSMPVYGNKPSCKGLSLSTSQPECALLEGLDPLPTDTTTQAPTLQTTQREEPNSTTTDSNNSTDHIALYISLSVVGLVIAVVVFLLIILAIYNCKRASRSNKPKTVGRGSRVVRDWHAVVVRDPSSSTQHDNSPRYSVHHTFAPAAPPPHTVPPVLDQTRDSAVTSSGYIDVNPTHREGNEHSVLEAPYSVYNGALSYRDNRRQWITPNGPRLNAGFNGQLAIKRLASNELTQSLPVGDSHTNEGEDQEQSSNSYENYRPQNGSMHTTLNSIQEGGTALPRHTGTCTAASKNERKRFKGRSSLSVVAPRSTNIQTSTEAEAYSVVGNRSHIYQGLRSETMDYISLYHTVSK